MPDKSVPAVGDPALRAAVSELRAAKASLEAEAARLVEAAKERLWPPVARRLVTPVVKYQAAQLKLVAEAAKVLTEAAEGAARYISVDGTPSKEDATRAFSQVA